MNVYGRIDETTETSHYRYRDRSDNRIESVQDQETKKRTPTPFFSILIGSAVATALSVILPFVFDLLSPQQTQDFYTGWALHQGGHVYTDYYGTNGLLYYLLTYISQGSVLFAFVEWVALFGAGIFLFKSTDILTGKGEQAKQLLGIFYLLVAGLSFGGGYATILALPFLFYALNLVTTYFAESNHDKGFLRIGMSLALAFFFAPLVTTLYALVLFFALLAFNIGRGYWARGFYQFIAVGLGFSLFFYPIGYYTVYKGSFGSAISQILYPIDSLNFMSNPDLLDNLLFYGLLAIGLGGLTLVFAGFFQSKPSKQYVLSIFAALALVLSLGLEIFSTEPIHGSRLAELLPFMSILLLTRIRANDAEGVSRRRRYSEAPSVWAIFLKGNAYLPSLALAYLFLAPLVARYILHSEQYQERARIETTVKGQTETSDRIYVWDDSASAYQASERLAASQLLTPKLHTALSENHTKLVNDLRDNQPKMIVVNTKIALWTEVEQLLAESYQAVQSDFKDFKLYKLK